MKDKSNSIKATTINPIKRFLLPNSKIAIKLRLNSRDYNSNLNKSARISLTWFRMINSIQLSQIIITITTNKLTLKKIPSQTKIIAMDIMVRNSTQIDTSIHKMSWMKERITITSIFQERMMTSTNYLLLNCPNHRKTHQDLILKIVDQQWGEWRKTIMLNKTRIMPIVN